MQKNVISLKNRLDLPSSTDERELSKAFSWRFLFILEGYQCDASISKYHKISKLENNLLQEARDLDRGSGKIRLSISGGGEIIFSSDVADSKQRKSEHKGEL